MAFCKEYNAATQDKVGTVIPVEITVFEVSKFFTADCVFAAYSNHLLSICLYQIHDNLLLHPYAVKFVHCFFYAGAVCT